MSHAALGHIYTLGGKHRIMCGDAGNPEHVAALFGDAKPDLVFTSPPYAQQRKYVNGIGDWDTMMQRVFGAMPAHEKTQVLVNLGLVHRDGEWQPYWDGWIEWMRTQGWRRFGWYVWDQLSGFPGTFGGRPAPCFEFIFHFNRAAPLLRKITPCKLAGRRVRNSGGRLGAEGWGVANTDPQRKIAEYKIPDSVFRTCRESGNRHHPAVFPVALPLAIHAAYTDPGELIYDPFCGSGTSILAAEQGDRICYGMEIEPSYVDIVLARWGKSPITHARQPPPQAMSHPRPWPAHGSSPPS